jgi:hypothetical protein
VRGLLQPLEPAGSGYARAMKPLRWSLTLGVAGALVLAGAGPAVAAPPGRSACAGLRGHDLASAKTVKLVRRARAGGVELVACELPRGRVRRIASGSSGSLYGDGFRLRQVAGAFAAVTTAFGDQYASGERTSVIDLRSGRSRTIAAYQRDVGVRSPAGDPQVAAIVLTPGGRGAAAVLRLPPATVEVVAFGAGGAPRPLDSGTSADLPPTSLALTGGTIAWTHAGLARTAPLP